MTTKATPKPYVSAEVVGGRLVRICPECKQTVAERTDDEGIVSDNFAEHWEAEHREEPPERERCYLLGFQAGTSDRPGPGPEARRDLGHHILEIVKRQMPEVDWELVPDIEELPEGAPTLIAWEVLRGSWRREGDDPQLQKVRWHRRQGEHLVFTPTAAQLEEWTAASERARDVRAALIERHRDQLPQFTGTTIEEWDEFYETLKPRHDEIARDFDAAQRAATHQFYTGDYRWQSTLEAAVTALGIPEDEVAVLREERQARLREAEEQLSRT